MKPIQSLIHWFKSRYKLRDGSAVEDPRLDRIPEYDERSRAYDAADLLPAGSGELVTRYWIPAWKGNQGVEGACVGFAAGHALATEPVVTHGIYNEVAQQRFYWEAQRIDEWAGGEYPGAHPSMSGTSILAMMKVLHRLGLIDSYRWIFNFNDLLRTVSHVGPVIVGTQWRSDMDRPDANGFVRATGRVRGYHGYIITGIDVENRLLWCLNSWSERWGIGGMFCKTFNDMQDLLLSKNQGEACLPVQNKTHWWDNGLHWCHHGTEHGWYHSTKVGWFFTEDWASGWIWSQRLGWCWFGTDWHYIWSITHGWCKCDGYGNIYNSGGALIS